jgi:hypothetical protein
MSFQLNRIIFLSRVNIVYSISKFCRGYPVQSSLHVWSLNSGLPTHFWLEGMAAEIREVFSAWSPVEGIDERVK